jgi:hypothetical protein
MDWPVQPAVAPDAPKAAGAKIVARLSCLIKVRIT